MSEEQKPHAAPKAAASMAAEPWAEGLREGGVAAWAAAVLGEGLREASIYLGQPFLVIRPDSVIPALRFLQEQEFEYLVDLTAVDYPNRTDRFELVYILYSFTRNLRLRVKLSLAAGQAAMSVTSLYPTANWLEREVFDLFGIPFEGHPDLRRILMPEDWRGHPLRKDYSIVQMDQQWVQTHLGIESGQ